MTPKALRVKLEQIAWDQHAMRLATTTIDRRLRALFAEADGDEAHIELVLRWGMAQRPGLARWGGPSPEEFWVLSRQIDCPDGAWAYRLWEYELAIAERVSGPAYHRPSRLLASVNYWLGYWSDAAAILDTEGVTEARTSLDHLKETTLAS